MQKIEDVPVPGNREVVQLLERWLAVAKDGKANYVAVAMTQMPNLMVTDFVGEAQMERAMVYALDTVKEKMAAAQKKRGLPERNPELGADFCCYNLAAYPLSYDFLPWLIEAEMTRRREGAPAPLKVGFWCNEDERWRKTAYHSSMYVNVMQRLLPMVGAVEAADLGGRSKGTFTYLAVTEAARAGEEVPRFQTTEAAMLTVNGWLTGGPQPVTITLREAGHFPHRNSNMVAWLQFAADLQKRGERVIFIRDTDKAEEPLLGHETCPAASVNLDLRVALYEQAKCNLFVPNGPWNMALFGNRPWLMFNYISKGDVFLPNNPGWWRDFQGVPDGEQFPWSAPDQRIIWETDDYEVITRAWQELQALQKAA